MLKKNISAVDVEEMQFKLQCAVDAVDAIRIAKYNGAASDSLCENALLGACWHLHILVENMKDLYDDSVKYIKEA